MAVYGSKILVNLDVEIVSPGNWIELYVKRPADTPEIRIVIPSAVALGIVEPVRLIVHTARGVRLVDLGTPPPVTLDANGNVTNALTSHIPNCLHMNVEHGIGWYVDHPRDRGSFDPPLEHPDWKTYLGRQRGIDVQLVIPVCTGARRIDSVPVARSCRGCHGGSQRSSLGACIAAGRLTTRNGQVSSG